MKNVRARFCLFTFVCGYHKAGIVVFVGYVYVSEVIGEIFDYVEVAIETGCSERGGIGFGLVVDVGASAD